MDRSDAAALGEPVEDFGREVGEQRLGQDRIDRARSALGLGGARGDRLDHGFGIGEFGPVDRSEAFLNASQFQADDRPDGRIGERQIRHHDHPAEQGRGKLRQQRRPDRRLQSRGTAGTEPCQDLGAGIGRGQDHGIGEVDQLPVAVFEHALVEHLVEDLQHIGMGLLDLVEQQHAIGAALDRFGQHSAAAVADIAGRGTFEAGNAVRLLVLRHVDGDERIPAAEQQLGQGRRRLGLAGAAGAGEQEHAGRLLRLAEFGIEGLNPPADRVEGGILADDPLGHAQAQGACRGQRIGQHPAYWNSGPARDYFGDDPAIDRDRHQRGIALLVPVSVDSRIVAEVVSGWTGIPVGRMLTDTLAAARSLRLRMAERIVGQDAALDTICRRIQTFYAELGEPEKPTGVFLLAGPSGTGKTETAATLAELLFGGRNALVTVNMSEYQEAHSVSGLKGAPPGYVGHGRGGVLTEAVKRRPYCVLLLDEIEKAHADVLEIFYQVFDKGVLEDSDGQLIDFTNTVILATANAGAEILARLGPGSAAALEAAIRPALLAQFPTALLGRMVVVPYLPLSDPTIRAIVRLKLTRIQERFAAIHRAELTYAETVVEAIAARATETESGARTIDTILTQTLLPDLSAEILDRLAEGGSIASVHVGLDAEGGLSYEVRGRAG